MSEQKMPSPDEMAKIHTERTLSDAELIKGGASYKPDETPTLSLTDKQKEEIAMEHEGKWWPDVATYVRANKKIIVPSENVPNLIKEEPGKGKGWIGSTILIFIDGDGNVARVDFDYKKIASLQDIVPEDWSGNVNRIIDELAQDDSRFRIEQGGFMSQSYKSVQKTILDYDATQTKEKAKFNF